MNTDKNKIVGYNDKAQPIYDAGDTFKKHPLPDYMVWWNGLDFLTIEELTTKYWLTPIEDIYKAEHLQTLKEVSVRDKAIEWWETFDFETKYIKAYKALKREVNVHTLTDDDIVYIYLHEPLKEDTTNTGTITDGEFMLLLNEGQEDESKLSLAQYINCFDDDLEADFMGVVNLLVGQSYQYGADSIKRIS